MINQLPSPKTNTKRTRVGRGVGSGHGGHVAGRGMKGQKSRSGYKSPRPGFEGGQMPLSRRLPTHKGHSKKSAVSSRGFILGKSKHHSLQLSEVAAAVEGGKVNALTLVEAGLIDSLSKKVSIKILFDQEIDKKLEVEGIRVSGTAKAAIEKAGGKVVE